MTYTVSAICMTPENDGGPTFGSEGPHMLRGVGSLITGGTVTTFNKVSDFNFIPAGYLDLDPASIDSTTLIFAPFIFLTAVNGNICLTVSLGISATSSKISYVTSVKKLQNNTATTYELANGWGDKTTEAHSDTPIWAPVSLFASGGAFYMLCLEILSSVEGQFFVVKTSSDGVSWTTLSKSGNVGNDPVAEAFFSSAGGAVLRLFGARTPISGKYFLGLRESGKLMYTFDQGNSWIDRPIGRFDGLNWYSDNGVMYLCAVRVGSNGCHGTKICDESGNMFPIEWRESAIPWSPSMTRLDAGYISRGGANPNPNPVPAVPTDSELIWLPYDEVINLLWDIKSLQGPSTYAPMDSSEIYNTATPKLKRKWFFTHGLINPHAEVATVWKVRYEGVEYNVVDCSNDPSGDSVFGVWDTANFVITNNPSGLEYGITIARDTGANSDPSSRILTESELQQLINAGRVTGSKSDVIGTGGRSYDNCFNLRFVEYGHRMSGICIDGGPLFSVDYYINGYCLRGMYSGDAIPAAMELWAQVAVNNVCSRLDDIGGVLTFEISAWRYK